MSSALSPHFHAPLRFALTGVFALVLLLLLFWTTSSADVFPNVAPDFVRTFTPAYGLVRLVTGLAAAAVGALLTLLSLGIYDMAKSQTVQPAPKRLS